MTNGDQKKMNLPEPGGCRAERVKEKTDKQMLSY